MFDAANWYWQAEDGRLYSSALQALIEPEDGRFALWRETGKRPTPWPSDGNGEQTDAALQDVLAQYGLYVSLDALIAALKSKVDSAAETERLRYVTAGAGQAMTYQRKVDEARRAAAAEDPKPTDYPFLAASLDIDGESIAAVAQTVLSMDALWAMIGSAIEAERLRAKAAIGAAKSVAEAQSAFAAIVWPSV